MSLLMTNNIDLLPGINHILDEARAKLKQLTGTDVFITISEEPKQLNEDALEALICKIFVVSWKNVTGTSKQINYVDARCVYCHIAFYVLRYNKVKIGRKLNRHHTSVIHLLNRLNEMIESGDVEMKRKLNSIETTIRRSYESIAN